MTKEEILEKHIGAPIPLVNDERCTKTIEAAMEEYAKQQAIAFVKYNCPDIKLEDSLLNAGYAGFLISQNKNK